MEDSQLDLERSETSLTEVTSASHAESLSLLDHAIASDYSYLSATIGSTDKARRAGT